MTIDAILSLIDWFYSRNFVLLNNHICIHINQAILSILVVVADLNPCLLTPDPKLYVNVDIFNLYLKGNYYNIMISQACDLCTDEFFDAVTHQVESSAAKPGPLTAD